MDAILHVSSFVASYASLVFQSMGVLLLTGLGLLLIAMVQNPDTTMVVAILLSTIILWHYYKPIRRFMRWYIFWPIGRLNYRLIKRPVRLLLGGIMARWKKGIVADELDETLQRLCYDKHIISKNEYRRMSNLIGKALGLGDLVTKKIHPAGIRHHIETNIAAMKDGPKKPIPGPPVVKADPSYDSKTGKVVSLSYLRRRNSAA